MLIISRDAAYYLPLNPQGPPPIMPAVVLTGEQILFAAEGRRHRVFLLPGNELLIQAGKLTTHLSASIAEQITTLAILSENPLTLVVGTAPARVYRLTPGSAVEPRASMSFDKLAERERWYGPAGSPAVVRSLAVTADGWLYADIHEGRIVRSADGGTIWEAVSPTLHQDVHQVTVSAGGAKGVYVTTANGVWISRDRGDSWAYVGDRLGGRYGRAIAVHPKNPNVMLTSVSDGPSGENVHGQLYRTEDGGHNWRQVVEGFSASTAGNIDTFHLVFDIRGDAWAIVVDQLYQGRFAGRVWRPYWRAPHLLTMLAAYA